MVSNYIKNQTQFLKRKREQNIKDRKSYYSSNNSREMKNLVDWWKSTSSDDKKVRRNLQNSNLIMKKSITKKEKNFDGQVLEEALNSTTKNKVILSTIFKYEIEPLFMDLPSSKYFEKKTFYNLLEILKFLEIKFCFKHEDFDFKENKSKQNFISEMNNFLNLCS